MDVNTPPDTPPEALTQGLVDLLDVEQIDTDLFRGRRQPGGVGRVFGGQVIAQALQAAQRSTDAPKIAHSLHAYFMRPGNEDFPIIFRVVRDFEGRSFATRRVIAMQQGQPILNMAASFQAPEEGLRHQDAMPDVPGPDELQSESELRREMVDEIPEKFRRHMLRGRPIEIRPVHPRSWFHPVEQEPRQDSWFRLVAPIGDDAAMHRAILAYASDMSLLGTAMLPHGVNWMTHNAPDREPRPCAVAARGFPCRRLAALFVRQPLGGACARLQPRQDLHARRPAGRQRGAGRADPAAGIGSEVAQTAVLPYSCLITGWLDDSPPSTAIAWPLT